MGKVLVAALVALAAGFGAGYGVGDNHRVVVKPAKVVVRQPSPVCTDNVIDCVLP